MKMFVKISMVCVSIFALNLSAQEVAKKYQYYTPDTAQLETFKKNIRSIANLAVIMTDYVLSNPAGKKVTVRFIKTRVTTSKATETVNNLQIEVTTDLELSFNAPALLYDFSRIDKPVEQPVAGGGSVEIPPDVLKFIQALDLNKDVIKKELPIIRMLKVELVPGGGWPRPTEGDLQDVLAFFNKLGFKQTSQKQQEIYESIPLTDIKQKVPSAAGGFVEDFAHKVQVVIAKDAIPGKTLIYIEPLFKASSDQEFKKQVKDFFAKHGITHLEGVTYNVPFPKK